MEWRQTHVPNTWTHGHTASLGCHLLATPPAESVWWEELGGTVTTYGMPFDPGSALFLNHGLI